MAFWFVTYVVWFLGYSFVGNFVIVDVARAVDASRPRSPLRVLAALAFGMWMLWMLSIVVLSAVFFTIFCINAASLTFWCVRTVLFFAWVSACLPFQGLALGLQYIWSMVMGVWGMVWWVAMGLCWLCGLPGLSLMRLEEVLREASAFVCAHLTTAHSVSWCGIVADLLDQVFSEASLRFIIAKLVWGVGFVHQMTVWWMTHTIPNTWWSIWGFVYACFLAYVVCILAVKVFLLALPKQDARRDAESTDDQNESTEPACDPSETEAITPRWTSPEHDHIAWTAFTCEGCVWKRLYPESNPKHGIKCMRKYCSKPAASESEDWLWLTPGRR